MDNKCISCLSTDLETIDLHHHCKGEKCLVCGLVWAKEQNTLKDLYESSYDKNSKGLTYQSLTYNSKNIQQIPLRWFEKDTLKKYHPFGSRKLLEIGCGTGRFLFASEKAGWETYGIDISQKAVGLAKELLPKSKIKAGTIEEADLLPNSFDMIVAFEVIEHVENPYTFLSKIRNFLRDDGILVISTPDWDCWAIKRHPLKNYWPPYHLWFFNNESLKHLFERAGLKIINTKKNPIPWSETCWPKYKRFVCLPFLIWSGIILRQGGGRLVIQAKKKTNHS